MAAETTHLPTAALEMRPMPRSAPDESLIEDVRKSGLPIRVRVFVEADGRVSSVDVLSAAMGDEDAALGVAAMFRDTAFIPGRMAGRDVASFIDIEIALEPTPQPAIPLTQF